MLRSAARNVSMRQIVDAELHLGHCTERWNPQALPYLLGERSNLHIINPANILSGLRRAASFITEVTRQNGLVLFVGTSGVSNISVKRGQGRHEDGYDVCALAVDAAYHSNQFYVHRWTPGLLTNTREVVAKHQGLPTFRPDVVVLLNAKRNMKAVREAAKANVPTVGIIDSDMDPRIVSYAIPGNDEGMQGLRLVTGVLAEAARRGYMASSSASIL